MSALCESRPLIIPNSAAPSTGHETVPVLPEITLRTPPLARGPHAVIYRGWDRRHRCEVIVKAQRLTDDPVAVSRFGREAAVMLRLRHPSIVTLYAFHQGDAGNNDPSALVMEYVPGQTLAALVAAEGRLPIARAIQVIEDIAAAMDCVHALGIVHRDIKPSNILLPKHGPARLTDFGVARIDDDLPLTVMGDILGTIEYASPEQVHGNGVIDTRSDVYSLAAVSYFALTGTPPFRAADSSTQAQLSVMHRQVFADPPPLRLHRDDLSPALDAAVLRGLAKAPDARYASAGQLAAALRAALAASSGEPQQSAMEASARRTGALAGASASAVLLLVGGFALWKTGKLMPPSPPMSASPPTAASHLPSVAAVPITSHMAVPAISHAAVPSPLKKTASSASTNVPKHTAPSPVRSFLPVKPVLTATLFKSAPVGLIPSHLTSPTRKAVIVAQVPKRKAVKLAMARVVAPPKIRSKIRFGGGPPPHSLAHAIPIIPSPVTAQEAPLPKTPLSLASAASKPVLAAPAPPPPARVGWYTVSGWVALAGETPSQKTQLVRASALWIKVDGQPLPSLASGQWAALPAGKHWVTFQPASGMGVGPKTWAIDLASSAHLSQQVPLPSAPLPEIPPHLRNP